MSLFEKKKPAYHIPTRAREVFDVTGAGDTVISTLDTGLSGRGPSGLRPNWPITRRALSSVTWNGDRDGPKS